MRLLLTEVVAQKVRMRQQQLLDEEQDKLIRYDIEEDGQQFFVDMTVADTAEIRARPEDLLPEDSFLNVGMPDMPLTEPITFDYRTIVAGARARCRCSGNMQHTKLKCKDSPSTGSAR